METRRESGVRHFPLKVTLKLIGKRVFCQVAYCLPCRISEVKTCAAELARSLADHSAVRADAEHDVVREFWIDPFAMLLEELSTECDLVLVFRLPLSLADG